MRPVPSNELRKDRKLSLKFLGLFDLLLRSYIWNTDYQGCEKCVQFRAIRSEMSKFAFQNFEHL